MTNFSWIQKWKEGKKEEKTFTRLSYKIWDRNEWNHIYFNEKKFGCWKLWKKTLKTQRKPSQNTKYILHNQYSIKTHFLHYAPVNLDKMYHQHLKWRGKPGKSFKKFNSQPENFIDSSFITHVPTTIHYSELNIITIK